MSVMKTFGIILLILIAILLYGSLYTINEGQEGLLLRLGKIVEDSQTGQPYEIGPGLHFKTPFVNQIHKFDMRLQTMQVQASRILTAEQKYVLVDYYVKWRIEKLPLYYTRTGGVNIRADQLLQQQINDALRAAFGQRTITEVVSAERTDIMQYLKRQANKTANKLGIQVIDVRIKSIDLPKEVSNSVFARMSAQREQVAAKHRSEGKAKAEKIKANADARSTVIIAEAKAQAAKVRAKGSARAARIYANAYNRDPKFYALYRSLGVYEQTFNNKHDILVLQPNEQLFKYFNSAKGHLVKGDK